MTQQELFSKFQSIQDGTHGQRRFPTVNGRMSKEQREHISQCQKKLWAEMPEEERKIRARKFAGLDENGKRNEEHILHLQQSLAKKYGQRVSIFGKEYDSAGLAAKDLGLKKGWCRSVSDSGAKNIFEYCSIRNFSKAATTRAMKIWINSKGPSLIPDSIRLSSEDNQNGEALVTDTTLESYKELQGATQGCNTSTFKNIEDHFDGVDLFTLKKRIKEVDMLTIKFLLDGNYYLGTKTREAYYKKLSGKLQEEKLEWLNNL